MRLSCSVGITPDEHRTCLLFYECFTHTPIIFILSHPLFNSQQLNFYSFRKIKYADTIRIDPELEKETANYWRFRHENFQRGKPQLLTEIKRMNGQKSTTTTNGANSNSSTASNSTAKTAVKEEDTGVKSEVQVLKKRIEEMTKNIDKLTNMVEKVSLKQDAPVPYGNHQSSEEPSADAVAAPNKRKKVAPEDDVRPDEMMSGMDLEDEMDIPAPGMPSPMPLSPESSNATELTQISDNEFVDQLFTAFKEDEVEEVFEEAFKLDAPLEAPLLALPPVVAPKIEYSKNGPDAELMTRLGDALMLLPKETQEMIVDRLIAAITSTDSLENVSWNPVASLKEAPVKPTKVVSIKLPPSAVPQSPPDVQEAQLPLAAATLAALLHHYSAQLKGKSPHNMETTIPVIPVHG
jgi:hypothetical protein